MLDDFFCMACNYLISLLVHSFVLRFLLVALIGSMTVAMAVETLRYLNLWLQIVSDFSFPPIRIRLTPPESLTRHK